MPTMSDNKRIAKNTVFLYVRMLVILVVGLYTVRIVLGVLGIEDYGIYNVVAGTVTAFSFIANTTSTAINRFLSYCLGQNKEDEYKKYFSNSFLIFIGLSVLALLLAETVGLWFVCTQLTIPEGRLPAAIWVYQSACVSLVCSFLTIPFSAVIISCERMKIFAYIGLLEAFMRLCVASLLLIIPFDSLKIYAVLTMLVSMINSAANIYYARRIYPGIKLSVVGDKACIKEMLGFTGWNLFGSISGLCRSQGINILINIFFGPVYNAARGIAYQIYNVVNSFASNFMMATNPQIIKLYAANKQEDLQRLVHRSSKMSYSLLMLLSFPIFVMMPELLRIWLKDVPDMTVIFARLCLINMVVESISLPLLTLAQATGRLRNYQIIVGMLLIMNLPVSWAVFRYLKADAYWCFIIMILINFVALAARLVILHDTAKIGVRSFLLNVVCRWIILFMLCVAGFSLAVQGGLCFELSVAVLGTVVFIPLACLFVVFDRHERSMVVHLVTKKFRR